ncbi:MAG: hypothetical protein P4L85_04495 [Paludisphaera borealis]|uniref:hypothetical protein n=1 Tax=Paludisphaera borealis TaxID=1387353 RepID=UPI00284B1D48|nr:hypothetical protein [Paludisphaera borealis]MDR3618588.1 hypothetical protein [Paludisphaera borealis]
MKNLLRGTKRRLAMVIRLLLLAVVVGLPGAADELLPVTVEVVDNQEGKPVTAFSYKASYRAPGRVSPEVETWTKVDSASGSFVVQAPRACRLAIEFRPEDFHPASEGWHEFVILSSDDPRRVVVELEGPATARGTVRDADTRKPIAGATVFPTTKPGHGSHADMGRRTITDKDGRYELRGIDELNGGVGASHPEYSDRSLKVVESEDLLELRYDLFLTPLPPDVPARGVVRDQDGKPLEGVTVKDGVGHSTKTAPDGTYSIRNRGRDLTFHKEGYVEDKIDVATKDGKHVVLKRLFRLEGRVVGPDGQPVAAFTLISGPSPEYDRLERGRGKPIDRRGFPWYMVKYRDAPFEVGPGWPGRSVKDREGRFAVWLERSGKTWVGVRADGYAAWEGWAEIDKESKPLAVRLEAGASVSAKVVLPAGARHAVQATLVPRRITGYGWELGSGRSAKEVGTLTSTVGGDGVLRFDYVRPDRYILKLAGPDVTTKEMALDVPAEGFDIGEVRLAGRGRIEGRVFRSTDDGQIGEVRLAGRGRIEGRVFRSTDDGQRPWAFADGYVRAPDTLPGDVIKFLSGEDGRFSADGVPTGLVKLGFPTPGFDAMSAQEWTAQVVEGQTTQTRLFDPSESRPLAVAFQIGDGSNAQYESGTGLGAERLVRYVTTRPPMLRLDLVPHSRQPLSFVDPDWEELDERGRVTLSDVTPGKYRLRVVDYLGSSDSKDGVVAERDVTVTTDQTALKLSLGGGCITGRILGAKGFSGLGDEVVALPRDGKPPRFAHCDEEGNFCVRYLDPGLYTLLAHDPKAGWSRVENVAVASNVVDVGGHRLAPGGTILGSIAFPRPCAVPDEVVATGPGGVVLRLPFEDYSSFDRFELDGLWPGVWTITARSLGDVLATTTAEVVGTEKVRVDLATSIKQGP